jgi:hypothetical protein
MTTLKGAGEAGNLAQFVKENRRSPEGGADAFNATLEAMTGKSKAVPATLLKRNSDD